LLAVTSVETFLDGHGCCTAVDGHTDGEYTSGDVVTVSHVQYAVRKN
jgi:hypothetical protein